MVKNKIVGIIEPIGKAVGLLGIISTVSRRTTIGKRTSEAGNGIAGTGAQGDYEIVKINAGLLLPGIFDERQTEIYTLLGISGAMLLTSAVLKNI